MGQVIKRPLLLIAGHGERAGSGDNARLAAVAVKARRLLPDWEVRHGVLSGAPSIEETLAGVGTRQALVWPFFICRGYFIEVTMSRRLRDLGLSYSLLQELGAAPRLVEAAREMLYENPTSIARPVLVVAHGSSKGPASRLAARRFARALAKAGSFPKVSCAFLDEPPFAAEEIAKLPVGSGVVSLFAGDGLHGGQDMAALIAESGRRDLSVVCPAVDTDAVAGILAEAVQAHVAAKPATGGVDAA